MRETNGKLFCCRNKSLHEPFRPEISPSHPHYFQFANSSRRAALKKHNYTPLSPRCSSASKLINFFALMLFACPSRKFEFRPLTFSLIKHNHIISTRCAVNVRRAFLFFLPLSFFSPFVLLFSSRTNFIALSLRFFNYSNAACLPIMHSRAHLNFVGKRRDRDATIQQQRDDPKTQRFASLLHQRRKMPFESARQRDFIVRSAPLCRIIFVRSARHKIRINESARRSLRARRTNHFTAVLNLALSGRFFPRIISLSTSAGNSGASSGFFVPIACAAQMKRAPNASIVQLKKKSLWQERE